jgi:hypothetical protein
MSSPTQPPGSDDGLLSSNGEGGSAPSSDPADAPETQAPPDSGRAVALAAPAAAPRRRFRRSWPRRIGRTFWICLLCALTIPPATAGVAMATYLFMDLPATLPDEKPQADSRESLVYAADGTLIGSFKESESRTVIGVDEIPKVMKDTVIASEDRDFYKHKGVDLRAIARAAMADIRKQRIEEGGSTITQQMVKNLYVGNDRSFSRKIKEALISAQVDRVLTKDEILAGVWDSDFDAESNIVEVYILRLRRKVDDPFGRRSIHTVRGAGYRITPP